MLSSVYSTDVLSLEDWGGAGEQVAELRQLAADHPNIEWRGPIQDVPGFLADCDVVLIPSRFEPFGLVCLEARAAGRAVVVSDVDGLPEQVQDCGLIVPVDDETAWLEALQSLPRQPLRSWGEQARRECGGAWEKYARHWKNALSEWTR